MTLRAARSLHLISVATRGLRCLAQVMHGVLKLKLEAVLLQWEPTLFEHPRLAIRMILSGSTESALAMLGLECSTFVAINKGTHKRDELMPWGDESMPSVLDANRGTSRPG